MAPFPEESGQRESLLPPLSSLALAAASLLLFVLAAVKVHNVSISISDETRLKKAEAELAALTRKAGESDRLQKAALELRQISDRLAAQTKERDAARASVLAAEKALDKAVKAVRTAAKDKKAKKAADQKIKKLKDEGERELAGIRERGLKIEKDLQKTSEALSDKARALAVVVAGPSDAAPSQKPDAAAGETRDAGQAPAEADEEAPSSQEGQE